MNSKRAFTLLEMLTVIAIIGILAALLLAVLIAAKKRADRATCMNNLRQINLGIRMYSDDSSDATPSPGISATSTNHMPLFSAYKELMKNYVGLKGAPSPRDKLFACPADKFFPSYVSVTNTGWYYVRHSLHDDPVLDYSSYAFNGGDNATRTYGLTNHYTMPGLTGVKFSSVKHPTRTILVAEASAFAPWSWHEPSSSLVFNNAKNMASFVDGHVSYIRIYWDSTPLPGGGQSLALGYNPPAGYDYQWSGD
jgi:prepilin-type N-terminal cleavage/methylation domain-containing protein